MKVDFYNIPEIKVSYSDKVKANERPTITCSRDASRIFREAHKDCMQHHEECYVMFLNRANRVLGIMLVGVGGMSGTVVDIRIILQTALKVNCSGICLAHNHPSGALRPSPQDVFLTKKLKEACGLMDIQLLDHIIVTEESYVSLADEGLF
ncbi:JAB domain-containing protein [Proteiniphilum sp. UBA5346]|uniref:JAB domain-containing protein n=1 Tax=Proteiniphilum sp. UBA5346 TaxID=1947277 RepID=UPI00257BAF80|nr:JAB domain-containing protein [Proteiniphilum sp. UBA5346]